MTKKLVLVLVIALIAMLAVPSVLADDSIDCCYPFNMTVVSNSDVQVIQGNTGLTTPYNAVAAWEPSDDIDPSYWDSHLDYDFTTGGADWIWESYRTVHPVEGDIVYFQRTFSVGGYPTAGTLHITCDNAYEAWLNGHLVGSAQLGAFWEASNRTEAYVNSNGWQSVEAWDVSALLNKGTNILIVKAANEYLGPLDTQQLGTIDTNPAGLIFQLDISGNTCPPCTTKNTTVVSNSTVKVTKGNTGLTTPYNAVAAWEPSDDIDPSYWDSHLDYDFTTGGADWIWESYRTVHPVEGDIVYFRKTFTISGYPTAGTLHITCDNAYEAWLNGHLVGSAQLGALWEASNRTEAYVNSNGWQSVEAWGVSSLLKNGTNTLIVKAANEYLGPLDTQQLGTIDTNPAGLIFQLDISYSTCPPTD
jgi:hypothetical protein